jgi:CRISPR type III-A-associated protein Csm2
MEENNFILEKFFNGFDYKSIINAMDSENPETILEINNKTSNLMRAYSSKITYTQFRNIHQEIKKQDSLVKLAKLLPKIAYIEARQENAESRMMIRFIRELVGEIILTKENSNVKLFHDYMDALVAYHKLHSKN